MTKRPDTRQLVLRIVGTPDPVWRCPPGSVELDLIDYDLMDLAAEVEDRPRAPIRAISASER